MNLSLFKKVVLSIALLFVLTVGKAQTLYFKCTTVSTASVYPWSNVNNWYSDAACTIPAGIQPASTNDVIISNNAFTSNNQTIDFDQAAMSCQGYTVNYTGANTGCKLNGVAGKVLSVFGNFDLTGLDTVKLSLLKWNSDLTLNPVNIGTQNVLTNKKTLYLNSIQIPGNITTKTVNFNDSLYLQRPTANNAAGGGKISIGVSYTTAASVIVNFNDVVKLGYNNGGGTGASRAEINAVSGTTNLNNGVYATVSAVAASMAGAPLDRTANTGGVFLSNSAIVNLFTNMQRGQNSVYAIYASGGLPTLNATNQIITTWGSMDLNNVNANFTNSTLNCYNYAAYSGFGGPNWYIPAGNTLNMTGSTLNIQRGVAAGSGYSGSQATCSGYTYNNINIYRSTDFSAGVANITNFSVLNGALVKLGNQSGNRFNITASGTFSMTPGSSINSPNGVSACTIAPTASLSMVGSCTGGKITFINFGFTCSTMPAANVTADFLVLNGCAATGTNAPFNPGANSLKVYNTTNTGWTLPCLPIVRTATWTPAGLNNLWSNPANWSFSAAGDCMPTMQDSVVIPPGSNIIIDPAIAFTKSITFVSTATITNGPNNAGFQIYGSWWATKYLKNTYSGDVSFRSFERYNVIKTGGVPFYTSANICLAFSGSFPPNLATCVPDASKPKGRWLLLDTLANTSGYYGMVFNSGILNTYSPDPAFAQYYQSPKKKGSTIISNTSAQSLTFGGTASDTVNLYDSDIYTFGTNGGSADLVVNTPNRNFNEGTSQFIFPVTNLGQNQMSANNRLYEVTAKSFNYVTGFSANQCTVTPASASTNVNFYFGAQDTIDILNVDQSMTLLLNSNIPYIKKATCSNTFGAGRLTFSNLSINGTVLNGAVTLVDSLLTKANVYIVNNSNTASIKTRIGKYMALQQGGIGVFMGAVNSSVTTNTATLEFANNATFISNGSCTARNNIQSITAVGTSTVLSTVNLLGTLNYTLSATDITDNLVTGGTLNTDGFLNGTTIGWGAASAVPRLLHWTDAITAGGISVDWTSSTRWRKALSGATPTAPQQSLLTWSSAPECPPTYVDTVYVDNASFSGSTDGVFINTATYSAKVAKLYFNTTSALSYTPTMNGVATATLSVYDSLYFCKQMKNLFPGDVILKGNTQHVRSAHGIKMAGNSFIGRLIIDCFKQDSTTYNMRDSLTAKYNNVAFNQPYDYAGLVHVSGNLNANGSNLNLTRYTSSSIYRRKLDITNSTVRISAAIHDQSLGGDNKVIQAGWLVTNNANNGTTKTYSITTTKSTIIVNTNTGSGDGNGILGGGYKYNDVVFNGTAGAGFLAVRASKFMIVPYAASYTPNLALLTDTFNHITNNIVASSTSNALVIGPGNTGWTYPPYGTGNNGLIIGGVPKMVAHAIFNNKSPMNITSAHTQVDSMEFYYNNSTYGVYNIATGNDYYQHWGLYGVSAPQQVNMAPDSMQYLHNLCDFRPAGNNANKVNFFSSVNGKKTYIRKDSSVVCADWLVLKDIWAIGSGTSLGNTTIASIPYTCTTSTTPWICDFDTLSTFDGLQPAPTVSIATSRTDPNFTLAKRAWFQAGNGTDFQSNNQGWERRNAETTPMINLFNSNTICEGDTSLIKFSIQGIFPFTVNFYQNTNSPTYPAGSNVSLNISFTTPTSYTQTPATATYTASTNPAGYNYYLVTTNGNATNAGTSSNPYVLGIQVTPTVSTQYSLGYLSTGKCVNNVSAVAASTGTAVVTVNPAPKNLTTAVTPSVICNGTAVTYTAMATNSTGGVYYLYPTATGATGSMVMTTYTAAGVPTGSLSVNTYTAGTSPNTYSVYVSAQSKYGCNSLTRTPVTVTVNPIPQLTVTPTYTVCSGTSTAINLASTLTSGTTTYSWTSSASSGSVTGNTANGSTSTISDGLANSSAGNQTVTYIVTPKASGCSGSAKTLTVSIPPIINSSIASRNGTSCISTPFTTTITVNPTPTVTVVSNDITVCSGVSASLAALNPSSTYSYTWSNASGNLSTDASYDINNIQMNQAGAYTVTVAGVGNCTNTAVANVTVNACGVEIPQLVTPNGDGHNDAFEVKNIQLFSNSKVQIFNRWGNIVYGKDNYQNDWKGTDEKGNGGILPAGTYFVIVEFGDGKTPAYHGYIQLQY